MATRRKPISPYHAGFLILLLAGGGLTGCALLPGGRPAADALTPAEHLQLGMTYEQDGKPDLALREYGRAAVGPERSVALTCQGNVQAAQGRPLEAEASYRAALGAKPDNAMALNNLAWLLAQENRDLDEAERLIRQALALGAEPRATYEDTLAFILRRR
ncbi:Tetratricopeptide repeat protein [Lacunisphaera limnophila]|uniref:Tetratricopeptide repeat protein n=1 Tax=Lacunisphaera limnophila TaxID=1838286 RepID=A0A1D8AU71_9BACT|nr:tetratricopeptide repeat protein [Lacunisphaera limnophila]AOS44437.1 Tetratricopeptide repeat protein [Lacunisphaera limnophila]